MSATAVITAAAARLTEAGYQVGIDSFTRGDSAEVMAYVRNGNRRATLSESNTGVFVSMVIDYGQDGTTFCDGAHLKSAAGIVKRVSTFLGEPKAVAA